MLALDLTIFGRVGIWFFEYNYTSTLLHVYTRRLYSTCRVRPLPTSPASLCLCSVCTVHVATAAAYSIPSVLPRQTVVPPLPVSLHEQTVLSTKFTSTVLSTVYRLQRVPYDLIFDRSTALYPIAHRVQWPVCTQHSEQ